MFIHNILDANLTRRQLDVIKLIAKGYSNKHITTKLGIADRTVQHHIGRIYEKFGCVDYEECNSRTHIALVYKSITQ